MPMSSQLISNKKSTILQLIGCQENVGKKRVSDALFGKKRFSFGNLTHVAFLTV